MAGPTANTEPSMRDLSGSIGRYTAWVNNFCTQMGVLGSAAGVGLSLGSGYATLVAQAGIWGSALNTIITSGRSHPSIVAARQLRVGTAENPGGQVTTLRLFVKAIQGYTGLAASIKTQLGINDGMKRRSKTFIPTAGPEIGVKKRQAHALVMTYNQVGKGDDNKQKPHQCKGCLISWTAANGASGQRIFTKTPCTVEFGENLRGQSVAIRAFWFMGNDVYSPPSVTLQEIIP